MQDQDPGWARALQCHSFSQGAQSPTCDPLPGGQGFPRAPSGHVYCTPVPSQADTVQPPGGKGSVAFSESHPWAGPLEGLWVVWGARAGLHSRVGAAVTLANVRGPQLLHQDSDDADEQDKVYLREHRGTGCLPGFWSLLLLLGTP